MTSPQQPGQKATVSVVLATFNSAATLPAQLDSLVHQTVLPDQLLVRDDSSYDASVDIMRDFAKGAPFEVQIKRTMRQRGFARNFRQGGRVATGDLVLFCDQDEVWLPHKIETLLAATDVSQPLAVFHDYATHGSEGASVASMFAYLEAHALPRSLALHSCAVGMTQPFIQRWGWPPTTHLPQDVWAGILSVAFDQRVEVDEVLVTSAPRSPESDVRLPSDAQRSRTQPGDGSTDLEIMIDLLMKRQRAVRWTPLYAEAVERGVGDLTAQADTFLAAMDRNRHFWRQQA